MALRPLAFSVRLRDREKGRTLRVRNDPKDPKGYLLEDERANERTWRSMRCSSSANVDDMRWSCVIDPYDVYPPG